MTPEKGFFIDFNPYGSDYIIVRRPGNNIGSDSRDY